MTGVVSLLRVALVFQLRGQTGKLPSDVSSFPGRFRVYLS